MSTWAELAAAEPEFAERVRRLFDAHRHKTMATLRRDGSPRISGIELQFADGEVRLGMMPDSVKAADLLRDPRLAVHSGSEDPPDDPTAWPGDAKFAGRAVPLPRAEGPQWFHVDLTEVVLTKVGDPADHLVIESWHSERGLTVRKRYD